MVVVSVVVVEVVVVVAVDSVVVVVVVVVGTESGGEKVQPSAISAKVMSSMATYPNPFSPLVAWNSIWKSFCFDFKDFQFKLNMMYKGHVILQQIFFLNVFLSNYWLPKLLV